MNYLGRVTGTTPYRFLLGDKKLRLTRSPMQAGEPPEGREIDLAQYTGQTITFDGQRDDDEWIWGVTGDIKIKGLEQPANTSRYASMDQA